MRKFASSPRFQSSFKVILIEIVVLIFLTRDVIAWRPRHFPKIGIAEFAMQDEEDHHMWETDIDKMPEGAVTLTDNGQTYLISQPILALTLDCNASYPIQWNFLHAEEASENVYSVRIRMIRHSKDVFNPLSNTFTSQLQLYGDTNAITGEYICFSTEYQDVQKKIYIYWAGSSSSPLIPQERSEDKCVQPDNTVILPCRVSNPDSRPQLYFEAKCNDGYRLVNSSPYIKFNTKVGFTIDLNQYDGAFGRYKCAMSDDDNYAAFYLLKNETCAPHVFNNTISQGASFRYSKKDQRLICCSNSQKPPSLQGIFCFDPVSCKMREFRLFKNGNNGIQSKNGNCVYEKIYERDSGLIRCKGDGVDVMRPFYTDLGKNETFNLYFDWNEVRTQNLISISVGARKPLFERQNISINCEISYFYFAEGVKWGVRWKNGSLEFLDLELGAYEADRTGSSFQSIKLSLHQNMTEVVCFAPVWNSTDWVNKSHPLEIRESVPPKFDLDEDSEVVVNLNLNDTDQLILCKASGYPLPALRWRKNNRTVLNENNYALKRKNRTLVMTIHRVSHETQGEYKCIASNIAGRVERVVKIYVIDPGQPLSPTAIFFVILLVTVLCFGVGFLMWRMQLQRKIITHLTGIVFRDMGGSESTNNNRATSTNHSSEHGPQSFSNGNIQFPNAQVMQESNHI